MAKKKKKQGFEVLGTQNFQDANGKSKHLKVIVIEGAKEKRHTGNGNYIDSESGVINHPTAKMVRKTQHLCGINRMM